MLMYLPSRNQLSRKLSAQGECTKAERAVVQGTWDIHFETAEEHGTLYPQSWFCRHERGRTKRFMELLRFREQIRAHSMLENWSPSKETIWNFRGLSRNSRILKGPKNLGYMQ